MKKQPFQIIFVLTLQLGSYLYCNANDSFTNIDSFLAKWEAASQQCRTLDVNLTVLEYDFIFKGDQPEISEARFYFEAPDIGYYENIHSDIITIWKAEETLLITPSTQRCEQFLAEEIQSQLKFNRSSWLRMSSFFTILQHPRELLPLLFGIDAKDIQNRYDLSIVKSEEEITLKANPIQPSDKELYSEIKVIVDAKTYLASAIQVVMSGGHSKKVYVIREQKVNEIPADRDEMIKPDLTGFRLQGK